MSINKTNLYLYGAALAGVLTVTMFLYSVILVPVWNWVSEIPGAVSRTTSGWFSSKPGQTNPAIKTNQSYSIPPPAPVTVSPEKPPKPTDCDRIIKQLKAGKYVPLPPECEQTYQLVKQREQDAQKEKARQDELQQRDLDREKAEREGQARLQFESEREREKQQEQERLRAANLERQRMQQEAEDRRRQERSEETDRQQAQRAAEERERVRQREAQKRNEAIIKLGGDIRKIFKKNR
jgi:hypothetical protein